jgi:hypothetical protein
VPKRGEDRIRPQLRIRVRRGLCGDRQPAAGAGGPVRWWALALAAAFALAALTAPSLLRPLNRIWFKFGLVLHHIVNPIMMGAIFFLAVTPMAFVMRRLGKDPSAA